MTFDIVFTNPPFNYIKEFENIAIKHSNRYVWMISNIAHVIHIKKFKQKNIIYFKNLGDKAFKEEIEICLYLIDKYKENDEVIIEGHDGEICVTDKIKLLPGADLYYWKFAQDVANLELRNYDAYSGKLFQRQGKLVSSGGIKCIWSSGGPGELKYDYIDPSQKDQLACLGYHKIFVTYKYHAGRFGVIKYSSPDEGLANSSIGIIMGSKEECSYAIEYLNSDPVKKLLKGVKLLTNNSKTVWSNIPHHDEKDKWFHLYDN